MVEPDGHHSVLIVEDERLMRWSLGETFGTCGCHVIEASDRRSAEMALADGTVLPDIVLLDLHLPDSDDLDLLSTIHRRRPSSRIVLMSAYMTADIERAAFQRGAFAVLSKPFDLTRALELLPLDPLPTPRAHAEH